MFLPSASLVLIYYSYNHLVRSGSAIKRYGRELLFAVHAQNVTF